MVRSRLHHGTQTQLNFVPEHSRDFIFTVVGEEGGIPLVPSRCRRLRRVALRRHQAMLAARDRFGFLLAAGIVGMFAFHIVVNVG